MLSKRPLTCAECHEKLFYLGDGIYHCSECGSTFSDGYGLVKQFLEEHPQASFAEIKKGTGAAPEILAALLENGKLVFEDSADYDLKCARCGCVLRTGRYCKDCYEELVVGLQDAKPYKNGNALNDSPAGKSDGQKLGYLSSSSPKGKMHTKFPR